MHVSAIKMWGVDIQRWKNIKCILLIWITFQWWHAQIQCPLLQLLITIYANSRVLLKDDLLFAYHAMPSWSIWFVPIRWSPSPSPYIIMIVSLSILNNERTSRRRETARRYWYIYTISAPNLHNKVFRFFFFDEFD